MPESITILTADDVRVIAREEANAAMLKLEERLRDCAERLATLGNATNLTPANLTAPTRPKCLKCNDYRAVVDDHSGVLWCSACDLTFPSPPLHSPVAATDAPAKSRGREIAEKMIGVKSLGRDEFYITLKYADDANPTLIGGSQSGGGAALDASILTRDVAAAIDAAHAAGVERGRKEQASPAPSLTARAMADAICSNRPVMASEVADALSAMERQTERKTVERCIEKLEPLGWSVDQKP